MALTPRSFFRSPALLVAAIFSVAIAMLGAAVCLSVFCTKRSNTAACKLTPPIDQLQYFRSSPCAHTLNPKPVSVAAWTEGEFVDLASCLEREGQAGLAVNASVLGLRYFPASEPLHNIRGYNLIVQEKYEEAVHALRAGLRAVGEPVMGTLQNNLAWAGLYASDTMTLSEARKHYQESLATEGSSCEALHTGMWVEYGVASRSSGASRDAAIAAYQTLRQKYAPCASRAAHGDQLTRYEVAGAGILDVEISKLSMIQVFERFHELDNAADIRWKDFDDSLVQVSLRGLEFHTTADIDEACEDIAPVRSAIPQCRKSLQATLR